MPNIVSDTSNKFENMRKEDAKLVNGMFLCHQPKGGSVKFSYRKYKGDPIKTYTLVDSTKYELPLAVVKHINNCGWNVHANLLDSQGNPFIGTGKKENRFTFQSLDYI